MLELKHLRIIRSSRNTNTLTRSFDNFDSLTNQLLRILA